MGKTGGVTNGVFGACILVTKPLNLSARRRLMA